MLPDQFPVDFEGLCCRVSMHLMVLGASRRTMKDLKDFREDVSMHLMVLGASRLQDLALGAAEVGQVSMHLMVLGASRP